MAQPPSPPRVPTGQELYDLIMGHIEPELTSQGMLLLDAQYAGETPADRTARQNRYQLAFERYETAYSEYMATLQAQTARFQKQAFAHAEMEDRVHEENVLATLMQSFS